MKHACLQPILCGMDRPTPSPSRFALVPRASHGRHGEGPRVKRYSLARIQPSPRSALGEDRHERLERAAGQRPHRPT
jgi:hypothetical protein